MGDWFLEQQLNITFCVKLRKNASDTCTVFSKAYGGEAMKKSSGFDWHKQSKKSSNVKITNEDSACHFL
jgi:hypothetical protein